MHSIVNYFKESKKAQMKIQEMAFVLVALMIFFAIVALLFLTIRLSGLKKEAVELRGEEAKEIVRKLANTPEFKLNDECESCIDMDKIIVLKERKGYNGFWNLDYLALEVIYPKKGNKECDKANYPDCSSFTLAEKSSNIGIPESAYVALCRQEWKGQRYLKCEIGKIYASGKALE